MDHVNKKETKALMEEAFPYGSCHVEARAGLNALGEGNILGNLDMAKVVSGAVAKMIFLSFNILVCRYAS